MVSHFWMDSPSGMAWSAGLVTLAFVHVSLRALFGLSTAPVPKEARLPVALAFLNVLGAALLGMVLAVNKVSPFLEVRHLDAVFAHAHLAGLGWGTLMVMGAGYRMLPMILPAAMPRGAFVYASAVMVELGVIGLVVSFLNGGRGLAAAALAAAAGIGLFLSRVAWMLRNRRPAPTELRWPDWGTWHALQAMLYLVAALALGLYLALAPVSEGAPGIAMAYGVFGLVGFLSQIVVGVEARVLPLFGWLWGFADRGYAELASLAPCRPRARSPGPRLRSLDGGRTPSRERPRPRSAGPGRGRGGRAPRRGAREPRQHRRGPDPAVEGRGSRLRCARGPAHRRGTACDRSLPGARGRRPVAARRGLDPPVLRQGRDALLGRRFVRLSLHPRRAGARRS